MDERTPGMPPVRPLPQGEPTVAVAGAGRMGSALVRRLLVANRAVSVWNRTPIRVDPLEQLGAVRLPELAGIAGHDVVISSVLDDDALDDLAARIPAVDGGPSIWIDCSTVSPAAAAGAASAAHGAGMAYLSAPVSGNPGVVDAGEAAFVVSGDPRALPAAERILGAIGRQVVPVGTGTEANVIKLGVNAVLTITMQALAEVVVLGEKAGVPRGAFMGFFNDSAPGSRYSQAKTGAIVDSDYAPTFTAAGQRKDIWLAQALAREVGTAMPLLAATEVEYSRLAASPWSELDYAALVLQAARDAGLDWQPNGRDR
ncbi:MAG TPA: NAD(P)-dependent oxidoreductase [Pseudolysinimonas sp.]|jgi:3-hydroxyisobutyrate dehydrogenase-like beta-hydroxyacid dehydrogenase